MSQLEDLVEAWLEQISSWEARRRHKSLSPRCPIHHRILYQVLQGRGDWFRCELWWNDLGSKILDRFRPDFRSQHPVQWWTLDQAFGLALKMREINAKREFDLQLWGLLRPHHEFRHRHHHLPKSCAGYGRAIFSVSLGPIPEPFWIQWHPRWHLH